MCRLSNMPPHPLRYVNILFTICAVSLWRAAQNVVVTGKMYYNRFDVNSKGTA